MLLSYSAASISFPVGFPIIPIVISLIISSSGEKGLESYTNENL